MTTHRLIVPLDGSVLAESAIPWADALAEPLKAVIDLVAVVPHDLPGEAPIAEIAFGRRFDRPKPDEPAEPPPDPESLAIRAAEADLTGVRLARTWHGAVQATVLRGEPGPTIAAHASQTDASLIVMATHAREGPARSLLGSVAGEVINHTQTPVWALHPGLQWAGRLPERVLVPIDGSGLSEAVVPAVTSFALALGWSLVLFTVEEHHFGSPPAGATSAVAQYLETVAEPARAAGVSVEVQIASGKRVEAIVEAVRGMGCGLVAMSTHGRRGPARWVRGSVTDAVVHQADVPVFVVRPKMAPKRPDGG